MAPLIDSGIRKIVIVVLVAVPVLGACSYDGDGAGLNEQTREAMGKAADEALQTLRQEAAALGQTQLTDLPQQIKPYFDAVGAAGSLVVDRAKGLKDNEFWVFVLSALRWTGLSASTIPAGETISLEALVEETTDSQVEPDPTELRNDATRLLMWAGQLVFYNEKSIMDQLVPAEALLRKEYDQDADGRIDVPLPPIGVPPSTGGRWQQFDDAVANSGDPLQFARTEIGRAAAQPDFVPSS